MREKKKKRESGFVPLREGVSGKATAGVFLGIRTRFEDRVLRAFRTRGCDIRISASDRFADASFRIAVSGTGAEHFVFADLKLLLWLKDVLQAAVGHDWKFPKGCSHRSGSRTLSVGRYTLKDISFLRILERCKSGKCFSLLSQWVSFN
ncbi:hypothetical protein LINPERPRIM_LOCUS27297 [Linum perenne]